MCRCCSSVSIAERSFVKADRQWLGVVQSAHVVPCQDCGRPQVLVSLRMYARDQVLRSQLERADVVVEEPESHQCKKLGRRLDDGGRAG